MGRHGCGEHGGDDQAAKASRHRVDDKRGEDRIGNGESPGLIESIQTDADHQEQSELEEDGNPAADESFAGFLQARSGKQSLNDQLVGAVRRHRKEGTANEAGEQRIRLVESEVDVEDPELVGGVRLSDDRAPASADSLAEQIDGGESAKEIDAGLEDVGPDDSAHSAVIRID